MTEQELAELVAELEQQKKDRYRRYYENKKANPEAVAKKRKLASDYQKNNRQYINRKMMQRRYARKQQAIEYLGGICVDCKQQYPSAVFDFHHEDATQKETNLGNIMSGSWEVLQKELSKCILLCSNCHRIRHFEHEVNGDNYSHVKDEPDEQNNSNQV